MEWIIEPVVCLAPALSVEAKWLLGVDGVQWFDLRSAQAAVDAALIHTAADAPLRPLVLRS